MKKLLLTLTIFLFSSSLYAFQTPDFLNGFYGGVGYGYQLNDYKIKSSVSLSYLDKTDMSFKTNYKHIPNIFIGYKFNDYFSMDFQYNQSLKNDNNLDCINPDPENGESIDLVSSNGSNKAKSIIQNFNFYYPINEHHKPFLTLGLGIQKISQTEYRYIVETYDIDDDGVQLIEDYSNKITYTALNIIYKIGLGYEYALNKNNSFILSSNILINNNISLLTSLYNHYVITYTDGSHKPSINDDTEKTAETQNKFQATYNIGVAYKYTFDNR